MQTNPLGSDLRAAVLTRQSPALGWVGFLLFFKGETFLSRFPWKGGRLHFSICTAVTLLDFLHFSLRTSRRSTLPDLPLPIVCTSRSARRLHFSNVYASRFAPRDWLHFSMCTLVTRLDRLHFSNCDSRLSTLLESRAGYAPRLLTLLHLHILIVRASRFARWLRFSIVKASRFAPLDCSRFSKSALVSLLDC